MHRVAMELSVHSGSPARDATPRDPRVSGVRTRVYCAARAAPLIKARAAEHSRCLLSVSVSLIQNVRDATHCLQSPQLPVALRYYMYPCVVLCRSWRSLLSLLFRGALNVLYNSIVELNAAARARVTSVAHAVESSRCVRPICVH